MTVVATIDQVTKWVQENICQPAELKMPAKNTAANDENYKYRRVTPACFSLFLPGEEKVAPGIAPQTPSICVKVLEVKEDFIKDDRTITFELSFCSWDPAVYGKDIIIHDKEEPFLFHEWKGEAADKYFEIDGQGWRDLWNWIDIGLQALRNAKTLNGILIDPKTPVTAGPYADQDGIISTYPYWLAWISFKVKAPITSNTTLDNFL